ncbi:MvaI/BcnI family restriction endonuclease [Methanobacterium congolense]|uniref:MvaI/BcnI restriction endonuclease domain-containing protein n=1 Tax=Methanobacterium congolense TaxID=118062 RepID=A0A1D3L5N8_9EURY|nr:MvaI/BcnI family restriction endonuclease [Methanobacterium congolense]SCG86933.1 putative protein [Methanobacterium congolense]
MNNGVLEGFKKDFSVIKEKGWVESHRKHDTGIGKTFEDLIGIVENNNYLADYQGILELKASRILSESMVTLFTKAPQPRGINSLMREKYGNPDPKADGLKTIHTTFSALKFNNFVKNYGFKLEINESERRIYILVKNLKTGEIEDTDIYYEFDTLKTIIENKCKYIAHINAESKKLDGKEYFRFKECYLLTGLTFEKFIQLIKEGLILYDIRIGVFRSGKNKGKTHDHGSGFRFKKNNLEEIFDFEKI